MAEKKLLAMIKMELARACTLRWKREDKPTKGYKARLRSLTLDGQEVPIPAGAQIASATTPVPKEEGVYQIIFNGYFEVPKDDARLQAYRGKKDLAVEYELALEGPAGEARAGADYEITQKPPATLSFTG
jgi:hypothetical protein